MTPEESTIETLRRWSQILLWVSIVLPVLGALAGGAGPRRLSAEQRSAMLPVLAQLKGRPIAVACRMMDGESCDYATELAAIFQQAGCAVPNLIKTSVNDFPGYVVLTAHGKNDPDVLPVLTNAFQAAKVSARAEVVEENSVGVWYPDVVHVIVGRKAP